MDNNINWWLIGGGVVLAVVVVAVVLSGTTSEGMNGSVCEIQYQKCMANAKTVDEKIKCKKNYIACLRKQALVLRGASRSSIPKRHYPLGFKEVSSVRGPFPKLGVSKGGPMVLNYEYQKCMSKASSEIKKKACENAYVSNLKKMHAEASHLPTP